MNILKLLDRPITFHPVFVDITGTINAALMLSNAVYWTNRLHPERDGWFHKSKEEWQCETRLTRHEQNAARTLLERLQLIETKRAKLPNSEQSGLWWRVDADHLQTALHAALVPTQKIFSATRANVADGANFDQKDPKSHKPAFTPPKAGFRTPKSRKPDFGLSLIKEHRLHTRSPPPPPAPVCVATEMPTPQPLPANWEPSAPTTQILHAAGFDPAFIASLLPEFRLFWQESAVTRNNWNSIFISHVRKESAYRKTQEDRHHDRSTARQDFSGQPARRRRETLAERNARYARFADAGTDAGTDAEATTSALTDIFRIGE